MMFTSLQVLPDIIWPLLHQNLLYMFLLLLSFTRKTMFNHQVVLFGIFILQFEQYDLDGIFSDTIILVSNLASILCIFIQNVKARAKHNDT